MKISIFLLFNLSVLFLHAQIDKNANKYAAIINVDGLKEHLQVIASGEMQGRETTREGERRAAAYLQTQFEKIGLKPAGTDGYRMPFTVLRDSIVSVSVNINGKKFQWSKDFGVFTYMNHNEKLSFSEVGFAGYGIKTENYNDYKDLDVSGKLVLVWQSEPKKDSVFLLTGTANNSQHAFPYSKILKATEEGAAGVLIVQRKFPMQVYNDTLGLMTMGGYKDRQYANTWFISEEMAKEIMGVYFDSATAQAKKGQLRSIPGLKTNIDLEYRKEELKLASSNVLGILEGTDKKDEYLFITAHYDHLGKIKNEIYYGADDNGSGTVSVLKIAEAFVKAKEKGLGPRRSIVFMLVAGEEEGLFGSQYYSDNPVFPLDKTTADLNVDMIGRIGNNYLHDKDSANYLYVIGNDKLSSDLMDISEQNNKITRLKLDYKYNDLKDPNQFYYRSDHYNFARKGVPVIFYFNGTHTDYHRPTDTMDKINFELMAKRAQLVFYTAWQIANRDNMLSRDKPLQ